MDRQTKNAILYSFINSLEKDYESIANASKTNDVRFKNMRTFVDENFTHEREEKDETKEKNEFIKENHKKMKRTDMANSLGMTQAGVGYYMNKLGLG